MLDLKVIPLMPMFVLANFLPMVFGATWVVRELAKSIFKQGDEHQGYHQRKRYRLVEAITRICETLITIFMCVRSITYSRGGWPVRDIICIFMMMEDFGVVIFVIMKFLSDFKKYIDGDAITTIGLIVIDTILVILAIAYLVFFCYISLTTANTYVR